MASNVDPITGTITDDLNNAWSYFVGQCTRFVAGALSWIPAGLGNAYQWYARAQQKGLPTIGPTLSPPVGAVAVWGPGLPGSGGFGHVAEVIRQTANGFLVAEENFSGGPGVTDTRTVTSLSNLTGFILPPGGISMPNLPNPLQPVQDAAGNVAGAIAGIPASIGHGLANALGAGLQDVSVFAQRQLIALAVAAVVLLVLFVH